jgi:sec-independent protein translocase protein TatA
VFGNIGVPELLIILAIVLLVFGANKVPEVARSLGKGIRAFKGEAQKMREELEVESKLEEKDEEIKEVEVEPQSKQQ